MTADNAARTPARDDLRALRYAQAQAVTYRARGDRGREREWLDMCALLDHADAPEPDTRGEEQGIADDYRVPSDRESLGRMVRMVWVQWATEQDAPKPSWLVPWEELSEPDREVDRRIGEALYLAGYVNGLAARPAPAVAEGTDVEALRLTVAEVLDAQMSLGTSGRYFADYRQTPETLAEQIVDRLAQRPARDQP